MRILVTGGAGFIGSHLTDALIARGDEVRVIDNLFSGRKEHVNPRAEFFQHDICDEDAIRAFFDGVDVVVHLAALVSVPLSVEQPWEAHRHNVDGTLAVLRAAHEARVKRFIFASSCAVYGANGLARQHEDALLRPQSPYAVQKLAAEEYCRLYSALWDFPTVRLRFFNVYGSIRQSAVGGYASVMRAFLERAASGQPLVVYGDGTQTRDFIYWEDVVSAIERAAAADVPGGTVYNIGSGRETSVNQLAEMFGSERTYLPARLGEMHRIAADISRAQNELGWTPAVPIEQGVAQYLAEMRATSDFFPPWEA